jgi:nicotinamide-nucleotide amidase
MISGNATDPALEEAAKQVLDQAISRKLTLATAESCTAGAMAQLLANAPGAGENFHGGFVVYTKENKSAALGVPPDLIARHSAVSEEVAAAMAQGALERCPADLAVAITGVAGPEPDEDGNPVGLVHVAVAGRNGFLIGRKHLFDDSSKDNICAGILMLALNLLQTAISSQK